MVLFRHFVQSFTSQTTCQGVIMAAGRAPMISNATIDHVAATIDHVATSRYYDVMLTSNDDITSTFYNMVLCNS